MLSEAKHLSAHRETFRGVYTERSECAQGDTGWQLMHIDEITRTPVGARFIAPTVDLSAFSGCNDVRMKKLICISERLWCRPSWPVVQNASGLPLTAFLNLSHYKSIVIFVVFRLSLVVKDISHHPRNTDVRTDLSTRVGAAAPSPRSGEGWGKNGPGDHYKGRWMVGNHH